MNNEIEKELKELQIQYDKVLKERNELRRANDLLNEDLEEYEEFTENYIKLKVENKKLKSIIKENKKLKEIIKANFDYFEDTKNVFYNYNLPVMEKEILEVLEDE